MHTKFKIIKDKLSDIFRMATWLGNIPHHRKTISWGFCLDQTAVYTKQWDQVWNGKSFMMNYCNTLGIHDWVQQVSLNNNMEKIDIWKKKNGTETFCFFILLCFIFLCLNRAWFLFTFLIVIFWQVWNKCNEVFIYALYI